MAITVMLEVVVKEGNIDTLCDLSKTILTTNKAIQRLYRY